MPSIARLHSGSRASSPPTYRHHIICPAPSPSKVEHRRRAAVQPPTHAIHRAPPQRLACKLHHVLRVVAGDVFPQLAARTRFGQPHKRLQLARCHRRAASRRVSAHLEVEALGGGEVVCVRRAARDGGRDGGGRV
eukprot:358377-Chlamydomonas_euryale.AAC.10